MFERKKKTPGNALKLLMCKKVKDTELINRNKEHSTTSIATDASYMSMSSEGEPMMLGIPVREYQPEEFVLSRSVLARIDDEVNDIAELAEEDINAKIFTSFMGTEVELPKEKQQITEESKDYVVQQVLKSLNCANAGSAKHHQKPTLPEADTWTLSTSKTTPWGPAKPVPKKGLRDSMPSFKSRRSPISVVDLEEGGTGKQEQDVFHSMPEPCNPYGVKYPPALRKEENIINHSLRSGYQEYNPTPRSMSVIEADDEREPQPAMHSPIEDRIADQMLQNLRQRSLTKSRASPSPDSMWGPLTRTTSTKQSPRQQDQELLIPMPKVLVSSMKKGSSPRPGRGALKAEVVTPPAAPIIPHTRIQSFASSTACSVDTSNISLDQSHYTETSATTGTTGDDTNTEYYSEYSVDRSGEDVYYEDDETSYDGQSYGEQSYGAYSITEQSFGIQSTTSMEMLFDHLLCAPHDRLRAEDWINY